MRKMQKNRWRRLCAVILAAALAVTMAPAGVLAGTSSDQRDGTFQNPVIYSDVPDIDIIRVEDAYYMVSTTMHLSPGCPIMKSTDLVNWEIVNYVYDTLGDTDAMNLRNGESMYGNGQWAASLKYYNGMYYVAFNCNTTGTAYLYATDDIERGAWTKTTLNGSFHDMSLFFDDNGKAYVLYGGGEIKCAELSDDLKTVKKETEQTLFDVKSEEWDVEGIGTGLEGEGTHILKKDGYYYVFNVCWPSGGVRTEICHRSQSFPSAEWENQVILKADFQNNGVGGGVAQGAVIDTADGKWYGFLFQDHGAVGRVPVLTDCTWTDGWPMLGKDGDGSTVEVNMQLPAAGSDIKSLVKSDEFYNDAEHRVFEASEDMAVAEETAAAQAGSEPVAYAAQEAVDALAETEGAENTETEELVANGDFENETTEGWSVFEKAEEAEIEVVTDGDSSENHVLLVKNRTTLASGAAYDLSGKLKKGVTYTVSGKFKYTTGPDTRDFNITFQNGPNYSYRQANYGAINAKKDEWTEFSIQYTPKDSDTGNAFSTTQNCIFIETPWHDGDVNAENDLMNYYLDDISIIGPKSTGGNEGTEKDDSLVELISDGSFQNGTGGWTAMGPTTLTQATDTGHEDSNCLKVENCAAEWHGARYEFKNLVRGKAYTFSAWVKYDDGDETERIVATLTGNQDGETSYISMGEVTAKKGEWAKISYTLTMGSYDDDTAAVYVHMSSATENKAMNFYMDDVSMTAPSDNMIRNGSFEQGMNNWSGMEDAKVAVTTDEFQSGTASAVVTERTACAQGPSQDLSNRLTPGNTYTIEAWVKYNEGVASKTFNITIQNGPDYSYRTILGSATAAKGEWTKITAVWTMPEDAIVSQNYLFFETPWAQTPTKDNDLMDFYVDNVSMIEKVNDAKEPAESGEHDYNGSNLDLVWQWNHNPNNNNWSLTERNGWLRLTTGNKASSILNARNTLTQRTYGPTCSGRIKMDISHMKSGDVAGLAAFSYNYGYIAVRKDNDSAKLIMADASGNSAAGEDNPVVKESVDCTSDTVYLKEDFNFAGNEDGSDKDTVSFYYSFDGVAWTKLGDTVKLSYELNHFMGSRFAIFNYATKTAGGYVDYDYFRVSDQISDNSSSADSLQAGMTDADEISGVVGSTCEVMLNLDNLEEGQHTNLKASISIPSVLDVTDVAFQDDQINGDASYTFSNGRLMLTVKGDNISFASADKCFATIKLAVKNYVDEDKTVTISADYIRVDNGAAEYDISNCSASVNLKYLDAKALAKKLGYGNPIMTQEFGADPYAIVYDGRVYVYMTADDYQYDADGNVIDNDFSYIKSLRVVSSADMMNWTDHGEIKVAGEDGAAKWAAHAWAPAIAYKKIDGKDKFFLYFANDASGIGVIEADTPLGPWTDPTVDGDHPNGQALITGQTPGCDGVVWCFDPAVLVDDDGSAYIYFGGGVPNDGKNGEQDNPKTARVAKLGADMVSIDGEAKLIDAPCMFEDSGIFKYKNTYYYSYCSNFIAPHKDGYPGYGSICYMTSDNPMGPFTYAGEIFSNPSVWFGVGGNNHHATFVFEGESYFIYHAQTVSKALGIEKGYRSTHIDKIDLNSDGTIRPIKGTYAGISQLHSINPYERIEAETIAWNAGIKAAPCSEDGYLFEDYNMALTDLQNGDWTSVSQLDFGAKGAEKFQVSAASANGGSIEIRLDSPEGTVIGTAEVPATDDQNTYQLVTCDLDQNQKVTGTKNIFLVFCGSETDNIMNVDYYQFIEKTEGSSPVVPGSEEPSQEQIAVMNGKIAEAKELLEELSGDDKATLEAAIEAAETVLKKENLTKTELEEALGELDKAVNAAKEVIEAGKPVDEQLRDKIAEAKELLKELTGDKKANLQDAIDAAEEVLEKTGATEEEMKDALDRLKAAIEEAKETDAPTDDQNAANAVVALINAIGKVQATEASKTKIEAARAAYNKLTDTQKALVPVESLKVLTDAETEYKKLSEGANNPSASEKISITKAQISAIPDQIYTGKAIVPSITVTYNGKSLVKDSDYTVSCKNNINIGTATMTIVGKGNYNGEVTKNFVITVKKNTVYTVGNYKYKIASAKTNGKGTVAISGIKNASIKKKLKKINIASTVKIGGTKFMVTEISKNAFSGCAKATSATIGANVTKIGQKAFYNCKKLKKISIKSTKLKSIGKNAIKGISAKTTISCPKKQKAKYKKLFKSSVGFKKSMKIK